ncbi:MAG: phosphatase PAP2 family protein [Myxococcota bacterium]
MRGRRSQSGATRRLVLERVLRVDESILVWVSGRSRPLTTAIMVALTRMGDATTWFAVTLFLLASGVWDIGFRLAAAAGLGSAVAGVVKRLARRPRPNVAIDGFEALARNPDQFSFPSGHTATAVSVALAMVHEGVFLGWAAGGLATGVASSRVGLGAHYPLDVLAGAALGAVTGLLARGLVPIG